MSALFSTEVWYETSARLAFGVGQISEPTRLQFQQGGKTWSASHPIHRLCDSPQLGYDGALHDHQI